jgi:hypothetical protein
MEGKMGLFWLIKVVIILIIVFIGALFFEIIKIVFALTLLSPQFFFFWCINQTRIKI